MTTPAETPIPHSPEAEEAVLGALLSDRDAIVKVATILKPSDFFSQERAELYAALLGLFDDRVPGDLVTTRNELKARGKLGDGEGQVKGSYLLELMRKTPTSAHVTHYAGIVAAMSVRRKLINYAGKVTEYGFNTGLNLEGVITKTREALDKITAIAQGDNPNYFMPHEKTLDWIDRVGGQPSQPKAGPVILKFGFDELDGLDGEKEPFAALLPYTLCTVLAYTNVGKTTLCQQIADLNAATGAHVLYLHTELSPEQMVARRYNRMTEVPVLTQIMAAMGTRALSEKDSRLMLEAATTVSGWSGRVDFVHCPNWGADRINQVVKARHMAALSNRGRGYDLVVLDYLQRTGPAQGFSYGDKVAWMGHNVNMFGSLVNELGVAGLMASQVKDRDNEKEDNEKEEWYPTPDIGSGNWTGDIEKMSTLMIGLTRQRQGNDAKMVCLKNTMGQSNWLVNIKFESSRYAFRDLTPQEQSMAWLKEDTSRGERVPPPRVKAAR